MSWTGGLFDFDENSKEAAMMTEIYDCLVKNRGSYEPCQQPLYLDRSIKPFTSRSKAVEWLTEHNTYWRCKDYGVRYLDYPEIPESKAMSDLKRRIEETEEKLKKYTVSHSVKNRISNLIGCKNCGSQLAREYLFGETCPLCGADLRAASTLETISGYKTKIADLKKRLRKETEKVEEKVQKQAKVMWLVNAQMYLG